MSNAFATPIEVAESTCGTGGLNDDQIALIQSRPDFADGLSSSLAECPEYVLLLTLPATATIDFPFDDDDPHPGGGGGGSIPFSTPTDDDRGDHDDHYDDDEEYNDDEESLEQDV